MDVTSASSMAVAYSSQAVSQDVGVSVMKKALDQQAETAMQLINSAAQSQVTPTSALPDNLGRNINVVA